MASTFALLWAGWCIEGKPSPNSRGTISIPMCAADFSAASAGTDHWPWIYRTGTPHVGALVQLLSFGVDTRGEMYVLTADDVFRIEPVR